MPTERHLWNRQYWHLLRFFFWILQLRSHLSYSSFSLMVLLKKPWWRQDDSNLHAKMQSEWHEGIFLSPAFPRVTVSFPFLFVPCMDIFNSYIIDKTMIDYNSQSPCNFKKTSVKSHYVCFTACLSCGSGLDLTLQSPSNVWTGTKDQEDEDLNSGLGLRWNIRRLWNLITTIIITHLRRHCYTLHIRHLYLHHHTRPVLYYIFGLDSITASNLYLERYTSR